ncbi:hypothetical protein HZB93_03815 [Candidatus Falkowbacteria bacterium]|nr:hypothetical protein [Candidatus Falkowbacteria bacterium]
MEDKQKIKTCVMGDLELWNFLYKKLLKIKKFVFAYDKVITNIELNKYRYDEAFQLILDSFSRTMAVELALFFDRRKDVCSLYTFEKLDRKEITKICNEAESFILMRHTEVGHLSKYINHGNDFVFYTKTGILKIKEILDSLDVLLQNVNKIYNFNKYYNGETFEEIEKSFEYLFNDLLGMKVK